MYDIFANATYNKTTAIKEKGVIVLINVAIVGKKDNVAYAMSTVVTKRGAKSQHIKEYSFEAIKTCSIVIFDLDNIQGYEDRIKKDSAGFNDIVVVGYSRKQDILDDFQSIMTVEEKPLRTEHLTQYLHNLKSLRKSDIVVNTDSDPLYSASGDKLDDFLNTDILSDRERMLKLKQVVNEKYDGPGEAEFLDQIGISDIKSIDRTTEIVVEEKITAIDYKSQFIDDALIMYRAKKLRKMHLTVEEIEVRIQELMGNDIKHTRSDRINAADVVGEFSKSQRFSEIKKAFEEDDLESSLISDEGSNPSHIPQTAILFEDDSWHDIEEQRREAIELPLREENKDSHQNSDNFTKTELKYIKTQTKVSSTKPETFSQSTVNSGARGSTVDTISDTELSNRLHNSLSPAQIERLKQLGVKI